MISCSDYDYFEIVCLYRYPVRLLMLSGEVIEGVARDMKRNTFKAECIELEAEGGNKLLELEQISTLEVTIENPHFSQLKLNKS